MADTSNNDECEDWQAELIRLRRDQLFDGRAELVAHEAVLTEFAQRFGLIDPETT
ncbi:hypothetical protein [Thalassospira profundimaris]|uniref:hypothetical protein n=1 Tax=Thalassospira profundimaris TaxID=502049 RepID=UPI0015F04405|nr:hypothetical protein [Thalassospira profundimaris]